MGFGQGVSALNASAANLDVIGNNIANSGTVGFKSGSVQFSDVYAGSRVGLGTQVAGVSQNFTQGAVQSSTRALDVAITNGDGFFRLASPGGEISYSRNGQFNVDKNGFLVNAAGLQLTGFQVGANGKIAGGSPTALQLPTTGMAPNATTAIAAKFNIDSRDATSPIPTKTPFDANDSETYNYSNAVTIYDSLGNSHDLTTFFVKTAPNTWATYATADGWPLDAGGKAVASVPAGNEFKAGGVPASGGAALTTGAIGFDGNGRMLVDAAGIPTTPAGGKVTFDLLNFGNGSLVMKFDMDLTGTTQYGDVNNVNKLTQDGFTSGVLTSYAINQDGTVTGKYSNEQTNTLGQIVLSSFINPNGLQPKGDNVWAETSASGQPLTGTPGSGTKLGALTSGALESSNVDLTAELVNLIIAQRTYQANSQTVKTQDQVMQTLINMR